MDETVYNIRWSLFEWSILGLKRDITLLHITNEFDFNSNINPPQLIFFKKLIIIIINSTLFSAPRPHLWVQYMCQKGKIIDEKRMKSIIEDGALKLDIAYWERTRS